MLPNALGSSSTVLSFAMLAKPGTLSPISPRTDQPKIRSRPAVSKLDQVGGRGPRKMSDRLHQQAMLRRRRQYQSLQWSMRERAARIRVRSATGFAAYQADPPDPTKAANGRLFYLCLSRPFLVRKIGRARQCRCMPYL